MSTVEERRLVAMVDDEKALCRAIGRLVMSAGLESEIFSSARSPFGLIANAGRIVSFSICVCPGMSGLKLQQRLTTDHCRTPIRTFAGCIPRKWYNIWCEQRSIT